MTKHQTGCKNDYIILTVIRIQPPQTTKKKHENYEKTTKFISLRHRDEKFFILHFR